MAKQNFYISTSLLFNDLHVPPQKAMLIKVNITIYLYNLLLKLYCKGSTGLFNAFVKIWLTHTKVTENTSTYFKYLTQT